MNGSVTTSKFGSLIFPSSVTVTRQRNTGSGNTSKMRCQSITRHHLNFTYSSWLEATESCQLTHQHFLRRWKVTRYFGRKCNHSAQDKAADPEHPPPPYLIHIYREHLCSKRWQVSIDLTNWTGQTEKRYSHHQNPLPRSPTIPHQFVAEGRTEKTAQTWACFLGGRDNIIPTHQSDLSRFSGIVNTDREGREHFLPNL